MRLPRTETTLAAVLLLSAAPFALAAIPPGAATPPATPSATTPNTQATTPPNATYQGTMSQRTASPSATRTAQAQSQSMQRRSAMASSQWSQGHQHARMQSAERVPQADIDAARKAKVSLTDAINTAQGENHGNVVSARFELRHGKPEYLIRTYDSNSRQEWLGHISADTGKLIGQGRTIPLSRLPKEDQQELTASTHSGATLAQAVQTAEQQRGGEALAAGLSARNGKVAYRTELLKSNGSTQMAMISPKSGEVIRQR